MAKRRRGKYVNATQETQLDLFTGHAQSTLNVGDFDNDGDQDLFFSINDWADIEAMLLNYDEADGHRTLVSVAQFAGFADLVGDRKGAVVLDYDMDGLLDIFFSFVRVRAAWYTIIWDWKSRIIGSDSIFGVQNPTRDALGSLVTLYVDGRKAHSLYQSRSVLENAG